MRILGIDPGFERVGIAILEKNPGENKERVLFSECFKTSVLLPFPERLKLIGKRIEDIIREYEPKVLAIEKLFFTTNQKTVMNVSEARGVILYEAIKNNLEIFESSPPQIKTAVTGYGKASKDDVIKMVKMLVKIEKKDNKKESDDELDAIAIALTAFAILRK
jgi:crossover junction endodeoxyribonuclease RuvC